MKSHSDQDHNLSMLPFGKCVCAHTTKKIEHKILINYQISLKC